MPIHQFVSELLEANFIIEWNSLYSRFGDSLIKRVSHDFNFQKFGHKFWETLIFAFRKKSWDSWLSLLELSQNNCKLKRNWKGGKYIMLCIMKFFECSTLDSLDGQVSIQCELSFSLSSIKAYLVILQTWYDRYRYDFLLTSWKRCSVSSHLIISEIGTWT